MDHLFESCWHLGEVPGESNVCTNADSALGKPDAWSPSKFGLWGAQDKGEMVMRAYTPTSSDDDLGHFDLVVKIYFANQNPNFPMVCLIHFLLYVRLVYGAHSLLLLDCFSLLAEQSGCTAVTIILFAEG